MNTGSTTDARPLQVRVADDLRNKIEHGDYAPGAQLPTLDELAQTYMCSLAAIRSAMGLLRQQGLVVTQQGRGTFVRPRVKARRHGIDRYSRSRWQGAAAKPILIAEADQQGHTATQLIRELAEAPAPAFIAEQLRLEPGATVWVRRRTTLIDDRPNQLADSYYPLDVAGTAPAVREEDTGPGGGYARLEDAGYTLDEIEEHLAARMPSGPESVALDLPTGTPVVELVRTTFAAERPVEVMHCIIAADMADFTYRFPIPD
ncbi:MAG: GntR family transcriptional regulator [Nocardioidaceae bacterium]